ncbi:MAG: flagellar hook-basal body complex protein [Planctomycetota bacterium]
MNYGLYLSAAGVLTNRYRQDVFANNLANVHTHAFKPLDPTISNRPPESVENPDRFGTANELLDRLGGGVLAGRQSVDFTVGPHQVTNAPLDAALKEDNTFFVVHARHGDTGRVETHVTRDGRFNVRSDGTLTTAAGHVVLDPDNQPIVLPPATPVWVTESGRIVDDQQRPLATLQVARVPNPGDALKPASKGTFAFVGRDTREPVTYVDLHVGAVEGSATMAVPTLMKLVAASKSAMGNANMIRYHDTLMDRAVNTLGRVA